MSSANGFSAQEVSKHQKRCLSGQIPCLSGKRKNPPRPWGKDIGSGGEKETESCGLLCIGAITGWRIGTTRGVTTRRSAAASRRSASTARRLVVASRGAAYGGTHLAHIGLVVEVGIAQGTGGTGTQLQSADVAGHGELGLGLGALLVADTHGEDGQVVDLN